MTPKLCFPMNPSTVHTRLSRIWLFWCYSEVLGQEEESFLWQIPQRPWVLPLPLQSVWLGRWWRCLIWAQGDDIKAGTA